MDKAAAIVATIDTSVVALKKKSIVS